MVSVDHIIGPAAFPVLPSYDTLSILSYNVLLPNSLDGWWTYKMYSPPATDDTKYMTNWKYRQELLRQRIEAVDADVVCLQEVSPSSFDADFLFMEDLGYDKKEMFKKGRFRPATFWKSSRCELVAPAVHKDRTLLTALRRTETAPSQQNPTWYILNCHLQAGPQAARRLRQINEGVRAVLTLARKQKDNKPEKNTSLIVCGDFNGGDECAAVRYLEDGLVSSAFLEDGQQVTKSEKKLPLEQKMIDAIAGTTRPAPPTMVVAELISQIAEGCGYENPILSSLVVTRLRKIYDALATHAPVGDDSAQTVMNRADVERYLVITNGQVGRGSEFRCAARQMGWTEADPDSDENKQPHIELPADGFLSFDGFVEIYQAELRQGKFWGIAHDMAVLGEPLPNIGVFKCRYDRAYCSAAVQPIAVIDFICNDPCPNDREPSDHLPVAAMFKLVAR